MSFVNVDSSVSHYIIETLIIVSRNVVEHSLEMRFSKAPYQCVRHIPVYNVINTAVVRRNKFTRAMHYVYGSTWLAYKL